MAMTEEQSKLLEALDRIVWRMQVRGSGSEHKLPLATEFESQLEAKLTEFVQHIVMRHIFTDRP